MVWLNDSGLEFLRRLKYQPLLQSSHGFTGAQDSASLTEGGSFTWLWAGGHSSLHYSFHLLECLHSKSFSFFLSEQSKREGLTVINMAFKIGYLRFPEPYTTTLLHFFMLLSSIVFGNSMDLPRVTQLALTWEANGSTLEGVENES